MAYTISTHQMGVQRANMGGLVRHEFRDVDKRDGRETAHSNELIDPNRTEHNISVLYVDGEARPIEHSSEVTDELDRRLAKAGGTRTLKDGTVKKIAVRKDAAVVRDIIIQLDPAYTGDSASIISNDSKRAQRGRFAKAFRHDNAPRGSRTPYWSEQKRYLDAVVDEYAKVYGAGNLLASSIHLDETSPHMHLLVTPIDEQKRVRQNSFIKSGRGKGSDLAKHDRRIRQRLNAEGYNADDQPTGGGRSHLSIEQYKDYANRQRTLDERMSQAGLTAEKQALYKARLAAETDRRVAASDAALAKSQKETADSSAQHYLTLLDELGEREFGLNQREHALNTREETLDKREKRLDARDAELVELEKRTRSDVMSKKADELDARQAQLDEQSEQFNARSKSLEEREETIYLRMHRATDKREEKLDEQKEVLDQREQKLAEQERTLRQRVQAQVRQELEARYQRKEDEREERYQRDKKQLDLVTAKMNTLLKQVSDQVQREKLAQQATHTAGQAPKRTPPKRQGPPRPWSDRAAQPKEADGPEIEL